MATRAAIGTGNFTTAGTWGVIDSTSLLASNSNSTNLTTSYVASSTFTPGAITVDGIAVWVNSRIGSTGTISIALDQGGATVTGTEVTINVSDIPADGNCWVLFKFAAPVTLLAATAYSVKGKTSNSTQVSLFRNATAGNWSRLLRTTTTGAPAASDDLYVIGEKTGAGTGNVLTVTMDNTASTTFGLMDISSGGKVAYGTSASTAYLLTLGGNLNVRSGGEFNIGTKAGTRMPSTSSGELAFSNAVNVDRGVEVTGSGIFRTAGAAITNPWALLAADAAASATSLTTNISTGWKSGDLIGIASTTRTATEQETKALSGDASGTTLSIAALANAHGGNASSLVQAELINLTRNVKIHGTSASLQAYINTDTASVVELEATEIYFMGSNTTNKRGVDVGTTTGSFYAEYCAFRDFSVSNCAFLFIKNSSVNHINVKHCVAFGSNFLGFDFSGSSQTDIVLDDCVLMKCGDDICYVSPAHQISNIRTSGCTTSNSGFRTTSGTYTGSFSNILTHSNAGVGYEMDQSMVGGASTVFSSLTIWRCNGSGWLLQGSIVNLNFETVTLFGNNGNNADCAATMRNVTIKDATIRAGVTLAATTGFRWGSGSQTYHGVYFVNCVFGGGGETHSAADLAVAGTTNPFVDVILDNCALNSATQIQNQTSIATNSGKPQFMIRANRLGQVQDHKTWLGTGTWSYDTGIVDVSPSLRLTPLSASVKLQSPGFFAAVPSGEALTASIKVRKSVLADGAAYNGNQPRLIVRRNYGAGITTDTVLDAATAAADGAFETLTGTTGAVSGDCALEVFVDCDGTAGWINVDSVTMTTA